MSRARNPTNGSLNPKRKKKLSNPQSSEPAIVGACLSSRNPDISAVLCSIAQTSNLQTHVLSPWCISSYLHESRRNVDTKYLPLCVYAKGKATAEMCVCVCLCMRVCEFVFVWLCVSAWLQISMHCSCMHAACSLGARNARVLLVMPCLYSEECKLNTLTEFVAICE